MIWHFSHGHFELLIFILAQKLTEKVQLILQLLHPYTFIPTSTVIRKMRLHIEQKIPTARLTIEKFALQILRKCQRCQKRISSSPFKMSYKISHLPCPIFEACFDLILGSSLHMKIQSMGGKITENLGIKSQLWKINFFFVLFYFQSLHKKLHIFVLPFTNSEYCTPAIITGS